MIILKNENLTVKTKSFGGELSSIKDSEGVEYLWQADPNYWAGQAPVLFPICGSVRNNKTIYSDGSVGEINRHGLVRKREFIEKKISDIECEYLFKSDDETLKNYPYNFELVINYKLDFKSLIITYKVKNTGDRDLPFFIGGHPAFNCPILPNEKYEDYYLEFETEETCTIPKQFPETGLVDLLDRTPFLNNQKILNLTYDLFKIDGITLDELKSRKITLKNKKSKKGLEISFEDFSYIVLWSTVNKSAFIAIEPWTGVSTALDETDNFEDKRNVKIVGVNEEKVLSYKITLL